MNRSKFVRCFHVVTVLLVLTMLVCVVAQANAQNSSKRRGAKEPNELRIGAVETRRGYKTKPKTKKEKVEEDKFKYSLEPFDIQTNTIDQQFNGHDIVNLRKAVDKWVNLKKGEFETTLDFNLRIQEAKNKANKSIGYGSLKLGDYVAFPMNSTRANRFFTEDVRIRSIELAYDADSQTLKITIKNLYSSDRSFFLLLDLDGNPGLSFRRNPEKKSLTEGIFVNNVPPKFAEKNIKQLTLCCVGQLYYYDIEQLRNEVFRNGGSSSYSAIKSALPLFNVQFWLYNVETGEVLVKFTPSDLQNGTTRSLGDTKLGELPKFPEMKQQENNIVPTAIDSAVETPKYTSLEENWREVLSGRKKLKQQSWEGKQPTLVVDSNTRNLTDLLQKAPKGTIVQIAKGTRINLGVFPDHQVNFATLDNAIAIVGETGDPKDAIIVVAPNEYLAIQSSNVFFKGITFEVKTNAAKNTSLPIVKVGLPGNVLFIDCAFKGDRSTKSIGILLDDGTAKFWNCTFRGFGEAGIVTQNGGDGIAAYCEFSDNKAGAKVGPKGMIDVSACFFSHNEIGYDVKGGGDGSLKSSLFEANETPWNLGIGSRDEVEIDKTTIIVKR